MWAHGKVLIDGPLPLVETLEDHKEQIYRSRKSPAYGLSNGTNLCVRNIK